MWFVTTGCDVFVKLNDIVSNILILSLFIIEGIILLRDTFQSLYLLQKFRFGL